MWNIIGRAVIVHASQDNCSAPVGGAGSRLAQCVSYVLFNVHFVKVIGYANPLTNFASWSTSVPVTQNATRTFFLT